MSLKSVRLMTDNIANDWIVINIRFKGKCVDCGKVIVSGQARWSKSTKAIKHLNCTLRETSDLETYDNNIIELSNKKEETQLLKQSRILKTIVPECFICGKVESDDDGYGSYGLPVSIQANSKYYICKSCLKREGAFETYRQAFLQALKKSMK